MVDKNRQLILCACMEVYLTQGALSVLVSPEKCNEVDEPVTCILARSGFYVIDPFDLQAAGADQNNSASPHQMTDPCIYQQAVLESYADMCALATLTVQGNNMSTVLSTVNSLVKPLPWNEERYQLR